MKLLTLSISILLLAGCTPSFQAGDCISLNRQERWEMDGTILKVAEVGNKSYRLEYVKPETLANSANYRYQTESIRWTDRLYNKVECPK